MTLIMTLSLVGSGVMLGSFGTILMVYCYQKAAAEEDYEIRKKKAKKEN